MLVFCCQLSFFSVTVFYIGDEKEVYRGLFVELKSRIIILSWVKLALLQFSVIFIVEICN